MVFVFVWVYIGLYLKWVGLLNWIFSWCIMNDLLGKKNDEIYQAAG